MAAGVGLDEREQRLNTGNCPSKDGSLLGACVWASTAGWCCLCCEQSRGLEQQCCCRGVMVHPALVPSSPGLGVCAPSFLPACCSWRQGCVLLFPARAWHGGMAHPMGSAMVPAHASTPPDVEQHQLAGGHAVACVRPTFPLLHVLSRTPPQSQATPAVGAPVPWCGRPSPASSPLPRPASQG